MQRTTILGDEQKTDSFKGATYRVERGEERATIAEGDGWIETLTLTPHNPDDGFQVGAMAHSWRTTRNPVNLRTLLIECANIFDNNDYVGYWLDDEGVYHIDPSDYYSEDDYYLALTMGIRNQQRSIWSFIQAAEVPVATKAAFHYFNGSETPSEGSKEPSTVTTGTLSNPIASIMPQGGYAVTNVQELEEIIQRHKEVDDDTNIIVLCYDVIEGYAESYIHEDDEEKEREMLRLNFDVSLF